MKNCVRRNTMEITNNRIEQFIKTALKTAIPAYSFDKEGRLEGVKVGNDFFTLEQIVAKQIAEGFDGIKDKSERAVAVYLADMYGYADVQKEFMFSICGHKITQLDCSIVQGQKGFYKYINSDFSLSNSYNGNTIGFLFKKGYYDKFVEELTYKETMFALSDFNNRIARAFGYMDDNTPLIDVELSPYKAQVEREINEFLNHYSDNEIECMLRNFEKQGACFQEKHKEVMNIEAEL